MPTEEVWLFDPSSDRFAAGPPLPAKRYQHGQASQRDGSIVVIAGGKCPDCSGPNTTFEIDTNTGHWTNAGDTGASLDEPTVLPVSESRAILIGGGNAGVATEDSQLHVFGEQGWKENASMNTARLEHRAALISDGRVLVAGGRDTAGTLLATAEIWDEVGNTWTDDPAVIVPMLHPRASHSLTGMQAGKVLAAGGFSTGGAATNTAEVLQIPVGVGLCNPDVCDPANSECVGDVCVLKPCSPTHADCNGLSFDGCETDICSITNCGACGNVCQFANASSACIVGACTLGACNAGFADCDGNFANGCETVGVCR